MKIEITKNASAFPEIVLVAESVDDWQELTRLHDRIYSVDPYVDGIDGHPDLILDCRCRSLVCGIHWVKTAVHAS